MLDIKAIRQNPEEYKKGLARKGVPESSVDELLKQDAERLELQKKIEELKSRQNTASKDMAGLTGEDKEKILAEMKEISAQKKHMEETVTKLEQEVGALLETLPNPPSDDAPDGPDDSHNMVIRKVGKIREFSFQPKEHFEIAENLGILDLERGAKVAGARFYFLKNELATLQMALMQWAFRKVTEAGFSPVIPPFLVREEAMRGTGFLSSAGKNEIYHVNPDEDDLYLIGTSEVPLTAYHSDEILEEKNLPVKFAGYSPCFRREAGAYGKDMKGILRVHQFEKIEMVILCKPEESAAMHELIRETEEKLLQELGIPYQVVNVCTGDLGNSAAKKYDLEAWLPGQGKYREMTSTSICTDFQSRRLNIRFRSAETGKVEFVHTLNGTAVSSRPIIAILENFQEEDGSVSIPECLWPYTGFERITTK
jgi:seryl-tRNA synthetase